MVTDIGPQNSVSVDFINFLSLFYFWFSTSRSPGAIEIFIQAAPSVIYSLHTVELYLRTFVFNHPVMPNMLCYLSYV